MSSLYGPITLTSGTPITQNISGYPDSAAVVIFNESPFFATVTLQGGQSRSIPAYTADILACETGFNGGVQIQSQTYLSTGTQAPSYVIFLMSLGVNDPLVRAMYAGASTGYPMALPRLQSVGNTLTVNGTGVLSNQLNNITSTDNTNIITIQAADNSIGANVNIQANGAVSMKYYDGVSTLYSYLVCNNVASGLLLGGPSLKTVIQGILEVVSSIRSASGTDLTLNANKVNGTTHIQSNGVDVVTISNSLDANAIPIQTYKLQSPTTTDLTLNAQGVGSTIHMQVNGTDVFTTTGLANTSLLALGVPQIAFTGGGTLSNFGTFNGTGPGNFAHGCPTTPYRVWFQVNGGTAYPISYDSLTSTTVNVHVTAGVAWFGFWYVL